MNVLQVLPELKSGGVERGTIDLAKYLHRHGHKAVVVSAGGPLVAELTAAGVTHYALPVHKKSPLSVIRSVRTLSRIVQLEKIDMIHARSRVPAVVAFFVSRRTQVPFVTTCHGFYSKHFLSRMMGWGKIVIVASRVIGRRMRDDFGVAQSKMRLIPRGVNLEEFRWNRPEMPRPEIVVGMIGRLTPIKGHPLFLKAMARVARVFPEMKIRIIGDAPKPQYKEELLALARHLGISKQVEFLGTRYDIPRLLTDMTVLAVPSVGEEAFGRVAIEAGACGVPVVATKIGGLMDVVEDGKDGLLVPPDDPRLLAEAVLRLIKEPAYAAGLAKHFRTKIEREFNLERMFESTLEVYKEAAEIRKILVIKMSAVGDVILSVPSLRALKVRYPKAKLSVLVGRKSRKILRNCPYVDDVITYDEPAGRRKLTSILRTGRALSREDFDMTVDLQNNRKSHWLAYLSGARVRAGHGNGKWSFLLNRAVADSKTALPPLEHQFRVLKLVDVEAIDKRLELWASPEDERSVGRFLDSQWVSSSQVLVGVNPGSSLRWPTKQWPVENFAKLCDELAKRNIRVVLTGSADDAPIAEDLLSRTRNKPINAVGRTSISELVALVKRCHAFVSSDSAPMHVAASADIPLVALFGPTDPKRHLVPPSRHEVFWKEVPCAPCYLNDCPVGHVCMKKITVQEVLDTVLKFVRERRSGAVEEPVIAGP